MRHTPIALATFVATATAAGSARAEYVENQMGRDLAAYTLGIAGTAALGFDIGSAIYLAGGPDRRSGRLVAGIGSIVAGAVVAAGSVLALTVMGEDHIPPGSEGGQEEQALHLGRALSGIGIALGVVSVGLGIGSIATYRKDDGHAHGLLPMLGPLPAMRGFSVSMRF